MTYLLLTIFEFVFKIANYAVWAYVILSWFYRSNETLYKIYSILAKYIEPIIRPIRKIMMPITMKIGLDFSPYVLCLVLSFVQRLLYNILFGIRIR